jgi:D-alanyl-D-alanine carboxypeptidase/D-alanyl-D-alanine-endopeptidase (penicillin-binding protein 4)
MRWRPALALAIPLAISLALTGCATLPPPLPAPVQAALDRAGLPADSLGFVLQPLDGSRPALTQRASEPMATGSTMKLVTAVVALDRLGINHRGRTELLAAAPAVNGVIDGPLILRGGADPDLDWPALWWLLRQLREQGVTEIRGGLMVDRTLFNPARPDLGAPPFDESPEQPYNVIPDALHFNGSLLEVQLADTPQGVQARALPALAGLSLDASALRPGDPPCNGWDDALLPSRVEAGADSARLTVHLQGTFPRGCAVRGAMNVVDRQWLTTHALRQLWLELGGRMAPGDVEGPAPAGAVVLATHAGRPLAEVLRGVLKSSDNALTRLIYLQLGGRFAQPGEPTRTAADRVVREWLAAHGLDAAGLVLDNGSGLSRSERITPALMAGLLRTAQAGPQAAELLAALPIAGLDGTMSRRLKASPAAGLARLKTGTLRDAVGLAGFVPDAAGRTWVFVALVNHPEAAAKGRPVLDALAEWVAAQR